MNRRTFFGIGFGSLFCLKTKRSEGLSHEEMEYLILQSEWVLFQRLQYQQAYRRNEKYPEVKLSDPDLRFLNLWDGHANKIYYKESGYWMQWIQS